MPNQASGGAVQQIHKGDVLIIPENTPHIIGSAPLTRRAHPEVFSVGTI
jgi:quercetin dioxygenase-like cupin family protein